jgi:hypothetical protein
MERNEYGTGSSHLAARRLITGIAVSIYLSPRDWRALYDTGSIVVSQPYDAAPADAQVVQVVIYQPQRPESPPA